MSKINIEILTLHLRGYQIFKAKGFQLTKKVWDILEYFLREYKLSSPSTFMFMQRMII